MVTAHITVNMVRFKVATVQLQRSHRLLYSGNGPLQSGQRATSKYLPSTLQQKWSISKWSVCNFKVVTVYFTAEMVHFKVASNFKMDTPHFKIVTAHFTVEICHFKVVAVQLNLHLTCNLTCTWSPFNVKMVPVHFKMVSGQALIILLSSSKPWLKPQYDSNAFWRHFSFFYFFPEGP